MENYYQLRFTAPGKNYKAYSIIDRLDSRGLRHWDNPVDTVNTSATVGGGKGFELGFDDRWGQHISSVKFSIDCFGDPFLIPEKWIVRAADGSSKDRVVTEINPLKPDTVKYTINDWTFGARPTVERKEDSGRDFDLFVLTVGSAWTKEP
jgi:hypothetical protein